MAISLGAVVFDEGCTTVDEQIEEVGGRDARRIVLRGIVRGEVSLDAIEGQLDAIAEAASKEDYSAPLSIRTGRRYWVRRMQFKRDVARVARVGTYELTVEARDPFEESVDDTTVPWSIAVSGAEIELTTVGNAETLPVITVEASGNLVAPAFSDGVRQLCYTGTVSAGQTLVIDGPNHRVSLEGDDATPYTEGEFPRIVPGGTTLVYTDDAISSHAAEATIAYRDRWW